VANFGSSDVPALLADMGVPVSIGGENTVGLVDRTGLQLAEMEGPSVVIDRGISVVIQTGTLTLTVGAAITVDGTGYKVRGWQSVDDGELTRVQVSAS